MRATWRARREPVLLGSFLRAARQPHRGYPQPHEGRGPLWPL